MDGPLKLASPFVVEYEHSLTGAKDHVVVPIEVQIDSDHGLDPGRCQVGHLLGLEPTVAEAKE